MDDRFKFMFHLGYFKVFSWLSSLLQEGSLEEADRFAAFCLCRSLRRIQPNCTGPPCPLDVYPEEIDHQRPYGVAGAGQRDVV